MIRDGLAASVLASGRDSLQVASVDGLRNALRGCSLRGASANLFGRVRFAKEDVFGADSGLLGLDSSAILAAAACFMRLFPFEVRSDVVEYLIIVVPMRLVLVAVDDEHDKLVVGKGVDVVSSASVLIDDLLFTGGEVAEGRHCCDEVGDDCFECRFLRFYPLLYIAISSRNAEVSCAASEFDILDILPF